MGNTYKDKKGYLRWSDSGKLVHRTVASKMVGGHIREGRVVHHNDGDRSDFRKRDLTVMSRSAHSRLHVKKRCGLFNKP